MNRHARCFVASPVLLALLAIPTAEVTAVGLSEAAKEAEKPTEEQEVLGRQEPSRTKHKEKAAGSARQTGGERESSGGWLDFAIEIWNVLTPESEGTSGSPRDQLSAPPPPPAHLRVGVTTAGARSADGAIGPTGTGGVLVGLERGRLGLDLRAQYTRGRFPEELRPGLGALHGWSGDAVLRWRLSRPRSRVGVALVLSGRWGVYRWDFTNPVQVATRYGVRLVERDAIDHGTMLAGVGIVPFRRGSWSLELTVAGGYQRFDGTTAEGFENDVFRDGPVTEGRVELVFSPRW